MWLAIDAVKKGEADVAVSAGNTGALMAMSRFNLRTMAGIERPAIAALWPTLRGESVVLDVGATIGADAAASRRLRGDGQRAWRASLFDVERPDGRAAQYRRRGGQGPRGGARGRPHPARDAAAGTRLCRLRRGQRHRHGRGRRRRDRRLFRQHRAQDRGRHGAADRGDPAKRDDAHTGGRSSATFWRARLSRRCATRWIRARSMAACSSASTASSSRAMAAPTPKASPPRSISAIDMVRHGLLGKISQTLDHYASARERGCGSGAE